MFEVEVRNVAGEATAVGSAGPYTLVVDRPADGGGRGLGFNGGQLLYLAVALSYAKTGQAGDAWRYWDKADAAARRLGDDYAHPWLIFGRGIVDGYAITMHNDLVQPVKALEASRTSVSE